MSDKLTEGAKFDEGKPRFELMPILPLIEVAKLYTKGAEKYEVRNWEKGIKWSRVFGALIRHAVAWWAGERFAKDDKQHHLAAVVWNALALMEYERTKPEFDDRWPQNKPLNDTSEVRINEKFDEQIKQYEEELKQQLKVSMPDATFNVNISVTQPLKSGFLQESTTDIPKFTSPECSCKNYPNQCCDKCTGWTPSDKDKK